MSTILKGIDLPKNETIVIHYANRYGEMETVFVDESDIIQIPKGHGSIIDGDEIQAILIKEAYSGEYTERFPLGSTIKWTPTEVQRIINDNATTILEAEE